MKMFRPANSNGNSCWIWAENDTEARDIFLRARYVRSLKGIKGCPTVDVGEKLAYSFKIDDVWSDKPLRQVDTPGILAMAIVDPGTNYWLLRTV